MKLTITRSQDVTVPDMFSVTFNLQVSQEEKQAMEKYRVWSRPIIIKAGDLINLDMLTYGFSRSSDDAMVLHELEQLIEGRLVKLWSETAFAGQYQGKATREIP